MGFFWTSLAGCVTAEFVWTKAHRSLEGLIGLDLAIARGNDAADAQAKACVKQYQVSSALYRELVQAKLSQLKARSLLDSFHIHLALAAIGQDNGEFCAPSIPEELCLVGPSWKAPDVSPPSAGFHEQFVSQVFNWFEICTGFRVAPQVIVVIFPGLSCFCFGSLTVAVCLRLRSMASGCVWVSTRMPYTWRRAVSFVLRSCDLVPGAAVSSCSSAVALGAQFALPGLSWRPRVPLVVRRDLCFQFSITLRSLSSLRLPPVWVGALVDSWPATPLAMFPVSHWHETNVREFHDFRC